MAKLEATLDANITPFQRALDAAKEKAKEFGEGTADVGKDLFKSLSGFDLSKALGIGGAIYAAGKLGDALIDAAKKGYAAFAEYQEAVLRFKYSIPTGVGEGAGAARRAEEAVEMAAGKAGIFSEKQMESAAQYLMMASKELRESPEKLNDMLDTLKAFAIKTSTTPEQIAESYRRLVVGIKEEGSPAVGKFFKATPGLEEETEKLRDAHAQAYLHAQGLRDSSEANTSQLAEYHRLQAQPISEFMTEESKREGSIKILEEIKGILERSAPKGIIAEAEAEAPGNMLGKAWEEASRAFGEQLKPAIDDFVRMLIEGMPTIQADLKDFGTGLYVAIEGVTPIIKLFGEALSIASPAVLLAKAAFDAYTEGAADNLAKMEAMAKHVDEVIAEKKAEKEAAEAPEKSAKAALEADTGVFSKGREKSEEEAAKIRAKSDAAHEASQRRINYERAQSDLRESAIEASRAAIANRPRGATAELDKEYAAQAKAEAAIINIRAAAQEKINAADKAAADEIAEINTATNQRSLERQKVEAMDDSAEKTATLARFNALDTAAEVSKDDIMAEAREKEREADAEAAEKINAANAAAANEIIDAKKAAADEMIDAEEAAALEAVRKMKPFVADIKEAPARWGEFGKWRHGEYIESESERSDREKENRKKQALADELNREWVEEQTIGIKREFAERKRIIDDQFEAQRPTVISLKHVHEVQQEEHVKAIEAEKGRTAADKEFAAAHARLGLPPSPDKEAKGAADVSRKVLADILSKIWDNQKDQIKEFEKVFMEE